MLIRESRLAQGLSQTEVGKKVKCHGQQISNIERGVAPLPLPLAKRLSQTLGILSWHLRSSMVKDFSQKLQMKWKKK